MIYDGTGSVEVGTGWYLVVLLQYEAVLSGGLVVLGQYRAILVDT